MSYPTTSSNIKNSPIVTHTSYYNSITNRHEIQINVSCSPLCGQQPNSTKPHAVMSTAVNSMQLPVFNTSQLQALQSFLVNKPCPETISLNSGYLPPITSTQLNSKNDIQKILDLLVELQIKLTNLQTNYTV